MSQTQQNQVVISVAKRVKPLQLQRIAVRRADASKLLGMCEATVKKLSKPHGSIPCFRCGSMVFYSVAALEKWAIENAERGALISVNNNDGNGEVNNEGGLQ